MKRISSAWMMGACLASAAMALGLACSSTDGPSAPPINTVCEGPSCVVSPEAGTPDSTTKKDAQAEGGEGGEVDAGPDAKLVSQQGRLFIMPGPLFEPFLTSQSEFLKAPAKVSLGVNGKVYSTESDNNGGFNLTDVPEVQGAPMQIEDIDGGAGIATTLWPANVPSLAPDAAFDLAVLPKAAIDQIVSSVTPPITLDPNKGHLLVTMLNSTLDPTGTAFAKLQTTIPAEAVVYLSAGNTWVRDDPAGTGPAGVALVVNLAAQPFPGETVTIKYTMPGVSTVMKVPFALKLAAGAINRVYFYAADSTPE